MQIINAYDPENNRIVVTITSELFKKDYDEFNSLVSSLINPKDGSRYKCERKSKDTAIITFNMNLELEDKSSSSLLSSMKPSSIIGSEDSSLGTSMAAAFDPNDKTNPFIVFIDTLQDFIKEVMVEKLKTTEFLPLEGYPEERLKEDLLEALTCRRNFCVVDTYESYLKGSSSRKYEFNQFSAEYGTSEWADISIMIHFGQFEEFRDIYSKKLERIDWI